MTEREDPNDLLLLREASLSTMMLCNGLTYFRFFQLSQDGFLYQSFFSLAIGLERLLKLILIYDYRLKHNEDFPSNDYLKRFGHKISDLFAKSQAIIQEHDLEVTRGFLNCDVLLGKILAFLNDFGNQARYYNLDGLSGRIQETAEPLKRWDAEINSIILSRHFNPDPKTIAKLKVNAAQLGGAISVFRHDATGKVVNNLEDLWLEEFKWECKKQYSVYYCFLLIRHVSEILTELENKAYITYPCLREFFQIFTRTKVEDALRRISWNPYDPFSEVE